jgi:hypothetical protein
MFFSKKKQNKFKIFSIESYTKLCIIMKAILFFGQHKKKLHKGPFKDYSQQNCLVLNKRDVRLSQSNALLAQQSFSISDQNHNYL